jgi:hypothetical protein
MFNAILMLLSVLVAIFIIGVFYAGLFLIFYFIIGLFIHGSLQAAISLMLLFIIFIVGKV